MWELGWPIFALASWAIFIGTMAPSRDKETASALWGAVGFVLTVILSLLALETVSTQLRVSLGILASAFALAWVVSAKRESTNVHKKLDQLTKSQKTALAERLFRATDDISSLTRDYNIRKREIDIKSYASYDDAIRDLAELTKMETAAAVAYNQRISTTLAFVLHEFGQYGIYPDKETERVLVAGVNNAEEMDRIVVGLLRMTAVINTTEW